MRNESREAIIDGAVKGLIPTIQADQERSLKFWSGVLPRDYPYDARTIHFQTGKYSPSIGNITIHVELDGGCAGLRYHFEKPGLDLTIPSHEAAVPDFEATFNATGNLALLLGGNEVEINSTRGLHLPEDNSYWDSWKKGIAKDAYQKRVYPYTIAKIATLPGLANQHRIVHADLFGGDGEFADKLIKSTANSVKPIAVEGHIYEYNQKSLDQAEQRGSQVVNPNSLTVHQTDLTKTPHLFGELEAKPDLVTAIGGLTDVVVNREQALRIANMTFDEMADGGYFILTGVQFCLLNSADFRSMGFEVKQMTAPGRIPLHIPPTQFYLLQKPRQ